jgi:deoxyribonuclease (pyrimidine dimer)
MTRVNCGISPSELSNKHLIAELREIKRIPNYVSMKGELLNLNGVPKDFKLNTGHVKFFYNKLGYLLKRYRSLYYEAKNVRGFDVTDYSESFLKAIQVRADLNNDYQEKSEDRKILIERLQERDFEFYKTLN